MEWIGIVAKWYLMLFLLGIVCLPITKKIFGAFFLDFAYPFSKTISILLLTYAMFVGGTMKILPFTQLSLFLLIGVVALVNGFFFLRKKKGGVNRFSIPLIIFEELLFIVSLVFLAFVRGQEPSIRGLEKFMDFGFMQSLLRSKYFPPLDMWLSADLLNPAGYPINYYYFGHLIGSTLIRLSNISSFAGYNLILATIFALAITQVFSITASIAFQYFSTIKHFVLNTYSFIKIVFFGLIGSFIVNFGGNLHTIYVFTKGYPNEKPVPFWEILSHYNPTSYWYPNATRFIPFTIHEFPIYSYVVADLHGHVFDIPIVLLTLSILYIFFLERTERNSHRDIFLTVVLGFLASIHYMTNAFDGPIYLLLSILIFLFFFRLSYKFLMQLLLLISSFLVFSLPFSLFFSPFVSGIGVNCSPDFLVRLGKLGLFLFEKGNCQSSPFYMLFILWGFFWVNFAIFLYLLFQNKSLLESKTYTRQTALTIFLFFLFSFGSFLVLIPEFFYIKDIYPAHFRANTIFKLGYQAFIMMGIASTGVFIQLKTLPRGGKTFFLNLLFLFFFFFIAIYPFFAIPSYYGNLNKKVELDGSRWLYSFFPEDKDIIDFLNSHVKDQPVVLEAQGDSYTDYERISAYTGLPTVAGWWVHEWLWRGSPDVVGKRIPDIVALYESKDLELTKKLIDKYNIRFVVVSQLERQKYPQLNEEKFSALGKRIFRSKNNLGALYQLN